MAELSVVKIKHATNGFAIINESDFDPAKDELFDAAPKAEPVAEPVKAEARPIIALAKAKQ